MDEEVFYACTQFIQTFIHLCTEHITTPDVEYIRGRPFDILGGGGGGGGAWVIFQKNYLSLVLQEKNNLSLKRLEKNNLSLKKVKKNNLAWPEKKKILAHYKGKASILFDFCNVSLASRGCRPQTPLIYKEIIYMHATCFFYLSYVYNIPTAPVYIYTCIIVILHVFHKSTYLKTFSLSVGHQ